MGTLTHFIPFVTANADLVNMALTVYSDCTAFRVPLRGLSNVRDKFSGKKLWIDAEFDGFECARTDPHGRYLAKHHVFELLDDSKLRRTPNEKLVDKSLASLLGAAARFRPHRISIPQLPWSNDGSRNALNRSLASRTLEWAAKNGSADKLILPVIATHPSQIRGKTQRTPRILQVLKSLEASHARTVWVVLAKFNEQLVPDGSEKRVQSIIDFHQELQDALPTNTHVIGGPYWGLHLAMWARGLISAAGISVGAGFQYYMPGGKKSSPVARIALPPLLRTVLVRPETREWLIQSAELKRSMGEPRHAELLELVKHWQIFEASRATAKKQVALFYRDWLQRLAKTPPSGRSLSLFQEASKAYVFGSGLPALEAERGRAQEPGRLAQLIMLTALA